MRVVALKHRRGDNPRSTQQSYRRHWTLCAAVNAVGEHLGPVWILQRRGADVSLELRAKILSKAPPGSILWSTGHARVLVPFAPPCLTVYDGAASGHINGDLFAEWMTWFVSNVQPSAQKHVLLILDGHSTRFNVELLQWTLDHHVHVVLTPPNSTAWSQVTDRTCFGVLKVLLCFASLIVVTARVIERGQDKTNHASR